MKTEHESHTTQKHMKNIHTQYTTVILIVILIIIGIPSPTPTYSLFHSRLKSFLVCKSSLPPFLFLLQDSLYGFPRLFTVTSEHIRLFTFYR